MFSGLCDKSNLRAPNIFSNNNLSYSFLKLLNSFFLFDWKAILKNDLILLIYSYQS